MSRGVVVGRVRYKYVAKRPLPNQLKSNADHQFGLILVGRVDRRWITLDEAQTSVPGVVTGRLLNQGKPVGGKRIRQWNMEDVEATTDTSGRFILRNARPGRVTVRWLKGGRIALPAQSVETGWWVGMFPAKSVFLKPGGTADLGDVEISPAPIQRR